MIKAKEKMLVVNEEAHGQAKEQAKQRRMTIKNYIEYLLEEDQEQIIREAKEKQERLNNE